MTAGGPTRSPGPDPAANPAANPAADAAADPADPTGGPDGLEDADRRATDLLRHALSAHTGETVTVRDLIDRCGGRAFGLLLLLFALPNCIPAPPAVGSILGLPLILFGAQMVRCRPPWLPGVIADRRIARADLMRILDIAAPRLQHLERIVRPSLPWAVSRRAERIVGMHVVLLAGSIALPVPLTNFVPAVGIAVMAIGLIERDGRAVLGGATVGLCGLILSTTVMITLILLPLLLLGQVTVAG